MSGHRPLGLGAMIAVLLGGSICLAEPQGMTIHRDPATGRLVDTPSGGGEAPSPRAEARPAPMTERIGISPGGGIILEGIPKMGVTASVAPSGRVVSHCDRQPAGEGQ
jgi:hypothetical protein